MAESQIVKLEEHKKADYIAKGGNKCVSCDSDNIEGGHVNIDSGLATQRVWCNDCYGIWMDEYKLVRVSEQH